MRHPGFVVAAAFAFLVVSSAPQALGELMGGPEIIWGSLLGGGSYDEGCSVALDSAGNVWVAGSTMSADFPTPGGFQTALGGGASSDYDVFVAKITPTGTLAWATYLGGSGEDGGYAAAIDRLGNVWVTGHTYSNDFPTPGAFQSSLGGTCDAYIARITPSGTLAFASYYGGSDDDYAYAITTDASGNAWLAGSTWSPNLAMPGGFQTSIAGDSDIFIAKVSKLGSLAWASYYGGSSVEEAYGIALDSTGNAWVAGYSASNDLPTPGGFDTTFDATIEGVVARIAPAGTLAWASYFGGTGMTEGYGIAVDSTGNAWVTGQTTSTDMQTPGGFQKAHGGGYWDAFVNEITPSGALAWASYLGGSSSDYSYGITVSASGNIWVTGSTASTDLPEPGRSGSSFAAYCDVFVARITPWGKLGWMRVFGGSNIDSGRAIATDKWRNMWLTGQSYSSDFPAPDGFQTVRQGPSDAFVTRIVPHELRVVNWLEITKLQMGLPVAQGRDSFVLQATCNMWPGGAPGTVTLSLDSTWSLVVDATLWKRNGKSNVYTAKQGGVTCKMTSWVGGTSKCLLQFSGSGQTLQGVLSDLSSVPVRLQIGPWFDETFTTAMKVKNHAAKMTSPGSAPLFYPERLTVARKLRNASRDAFSLTAKVWLASDFDPTADPVTVTIGTYQLSLPAGTMPTARNRIVKYTAATANGRLTFQMNNKTHALTVTATGVDLSSVDQDARIALTIANHGESAWHYWVFLSKNKAGTLYKY